MIKRINLWTTPKSKLTESQRLQFLSMRKGWKEYQEERIRRKKEHRD